MFSFRDQQSQSKTTPSNITKIYLDVPYDEKNEAKALGAKWDNNVKKWYSVESNNELVKKWGEEARIIHELCEEDRTYGTGLNVEFTPKSCWCKKIQYAVKWCDRTRLNDYVLGRVNRTCETCNVQDTQLEYHMHGRWIYNEETHTQKLVRLMALCDACNTATHFGTAHFNGRKNDAISQLKKVNTFSDEQVQQHIDDAYAFVKTLNQHKWTVDLSLLTSNGIKCETEKQTSRWLNTSNKDSKTKKKGAVKTSQKNTPKVIEHRAGSTMYAFRNNSSN